MRIHGNPCKILDKYKNSDSKQYVRDNGKQRAVRSGVSGSCWGGGGGLAFHWSRASVDPVHGSDPGDPSDPRGSTGIHTKFLSDIKTVTPNNILGTMVNNEPSAPACLGHAGDVVEDWLFIGPEPLWIQFMDPILVIHGIHGDPKERSLWGSVAALKHL